MMFTKRTVIFLAVVILSSISSSTTLKRTAPVANPPINGEQTQPLQEPEAASGAAQDAHPTISKLKSVSPYDIRSFIWGAHQASLKDLWQRLEIRPELVDEENPTYSERFLDTCYGCDAEIFEYDLDDEPGKEILLRVSDPLAESWRYLIFKRIDSKDSRYEWKLLGHIDHAFGRYREPQHSFVVSGGKTWLLVEVQDGSGSGFAHYYNRLFKVDKGGVRELLRFPSEGHESGCCNFPAQEFTSRIVNCYMENRITTVEIEFSVRYRNNVMLWKKNQKAAYVADSTTGKLVLDPTESDISDQELRALYGNDGLSDSNILKFNFQELVRIATAKNLKRKEWLRAYLNECENTPEKDALRKMLDR